MHGKLKRKFTFLCTLLTSLVLLAACLFSYSSSRMRVQNKYAEAFENQSQTLSVFLAGTRQIHYQQLYQMEKEGGLLLYFFDNDVLLYNAESGPEERNDIYTDFVETLLHEYPNVQLKGKNTTSPVTISMEFKSAQAAYMGKYVSTPTENRNRYSFFLVQPIEEKYKEMRNLSVMYALVFLGGVGLLLLISWLLAKLTVKPVEQAHRQQAEFIAAASHELKSPLAVMSATAAYAKLKPGTAEESFDKILAESRRMAALVDDLLILSNAETAGWKLRKSPASAEDILLTVYENFLPVAKSKGHTLQLIFPEGYLPKLVVDEQRIIQILSILLSNALAYSPQGTPVEIKARTEKKQVVFSVVDHGAGVADEEKNRIFDKFYRSDKSRNDKSHFGLGLPVAKELAGLHNGSVRVCDTAGGGATFELRLGI